jgi:DNA-directed RNA polymerase specialized sigma subunit
MSRLAYLLKQAAKKPAAPRTPAGMPVQQTSAPSQYSFPTDWKIPPDPRRQKELQLWKEWKDSGEDTEKLSPLLTSLKPLIRKQVRMFARTPIPSPVIEAKAIEHTIHALETYDPKVYPGRQTGQLHTWVTRNLQSTNRFVYNNQNMRRIVEDRAQMVGDYRRARAHLAESLGRAPTHAEIAKFMNEMPDRIGKSKPVTAIAVERLSHEDIPDMIASQEMNNPFVNETPEERQIMKLVMYDLTPDELAVFEYIRGINGKPRIHQPGDIARRLNWSPSKVSNIKKSIAGKIQEYKNA